MFPFDNLEVNDRIKGRIDTASGISNVSIFLNDGN